MIAPSGNVGTVRKHLSADALYRVVRTAFEHIPDHRQPGSPIPQADALMSAFAMFSLKDPSLLAFEERRCDGNLKQLFGIGRVPSDTQMREILDPLDPLQLRDSFNDVLRPLQRGKELEKLVFYRGCYLLSIDGTQYFSSNAIHCKGCLVKENKKTGETTYCHQMLGAALVHPDHREVIPLAPEPICREDGSTKNDCERNAGKRLLERVRREHPHLKLIVIEDGLASNGPHVELLFAMRMHFILGAKPGDHPYLFDRVIEAYEEDRVTTLSGKKDGIEWEIAFVNDLPLNESNPHLKVGFLMQTEYDADGNVAKVFSWITDLPITRENARLLARGGRARWKIENETFNTLKNQGYHYEHNYGHGKEHLSVVFAMLMMLAFLVDQAQQLACPLFRAVLAKVKSKRSLWEKLRSHCYHFLFRSMKHLYEAMLYDLCKEVPLPVPVWDSS